jgi:hypothetical protein
VAVAIARGKLHPRIDARRIFSQQRLDQTDFFEEIVPVERGEETHAGDDVAHRDLCGCLALVFAVNYLLDAGALLRQLLLDPVHHRHYGRMLFAQALYELDHKRLRQLFSFAESFGYCWHDARGLKRGELE